MAGIVTPQQIKTIFLIAFILLLGLCLSKPEDSNAEYFSAPAFSPVPNDAAWWDGYGGASGSDIYGSSNSGDNSPDSPVNSIEEGDGQWVGGAWVPGQPGQRINQTTGEDNSTTDDNSAGADEDIEGWWDYVTPTTPTTPTTPANPGSGSGQWVNLFGKLIWVPDRNSSFHEAPGDLTDDDANDDSDNDSSGSGSTGDDCIDSGDSADDPEAARFDSDNDGYTPEEGDLDDNDATIHPGAEEICGDGKDNDQDGMVDEDCPTCTDADGDEYFAESGCGTAVDCDDNDPSINPGFTIDCGSDNVFGDGIDNDCDGLIDEDCKSDDGDDTGNDDDDVNDNGDSNGMNTPPAAPLGLSPDGIKVSLTPKLELQENAFTDLDGDAHVKTRWLIGESRWDELLIVVDEITDTQLTAWQVPSVCILEKDTFYYWRVSVFDGKDWSSMSNYLAFWTDSDGVEFDENGIGTDSVIDPDEPVTLGSEFVDEYGNLLLSDTRKAMKSVVVPDIQIGMTVDSGCTINKICSRRPEDCIAHDAGAAIEIPDMPYGVIDFAVTVPEKGGSATVEFTFSEPLPENFQWWKYDPKEGGFYDFMDKPLLVSAAGVLFSSDRKKLKLALTDGGPGDMIEQPDGKIIDPSGFGPAGATTAPKSSSGGGGGSCFIRSLMF